MDETSAYPMSPAVVEVRTQQQCPDCAKNLIPVVSEARVRSFCLHCYQAGQSYLFWSHHTCIGESQPSDRS